jgi:uncharacterized protein (DUF1501 family)
MPINRRQFIKRSAGAITVSVMVPRFLSGSVFGQMVSSPGPSKKALVIIELAGGNDGLNTVIPYTDARYFALRPTIGFRDTDLKDTQGRTTILNNQLGLHPSMGKLKEMYDAGRVAVVVGVGYPNPSGSHFESADIWHSGRRDDNRSDGWLGRYAERSLVGVSGLTAVAIEDKLPKTFASRNIVVPNIPNFEDFGIRTDSWYPDNRDNKINTLLALNGRSFPSGSFVAEQARIGFDAVNGALQFKSALGNYHSTVQYPDNNPLAEGLQKLAQILVTIPESTLLYVQMGGFDTHSDQTAGGNKLAGQHATLLRYFSEGIDAFYRDLVEHNLADNVVIMQWSEFGRRTEENKSIGTDHGAASCLFVVGNPVHGGIYGQQPSMAVTDLDDAGNMKFNVDFRSVYATVIDKWLAGDSKTIMGNTFDDLGFL